jgi:hypothetical protein
LLLLALANAAFMLYIFYEGQLSPGLRAKKRTDRLFCWPKIKGSEKIFASQIDSAPYNQHFFAQKCLGLLIKL